MEERQMKPEESFDIINKAISNFKINYKEGANTFLLWGWLLSLAAFSNFFILQVLQSKEAYGQMGLFSLGNWAVFIAIGFVIMFFMERKVKREKKVYSHLDRYVNQLWWVAVASFFTGTFLCIQLEITPPPLMLLLAGFATTTTGLFIKFKPFIAGGIAFFAFSIASTFVSNEYTALVVGVAIICGYLIPGYLLRATKAQRHV
ncbi:MAG: hypothetical protein V2I46_06350 [Bacteroides sp.]|jgi:hypothetical protein|nr:hypothetical protein [Bacteroides sp.]